MSDKYVRVPITTDAYVCLRRAKILLASKMNKTNISNSEVIMYMYRKVFGR